MDTWSLFGVAWIAIVAAAFALSFPGIIVTARKQTILAIAASQSAAFGAALAMVIIGLLQGSHPHGDIRIHLGAIIGGLAGTAIGWHGSSERAGWLYAFASAGSFIAVANSPYGMECVRAILESGNALSATFADMVIFCTASVLTVVGVSLHHRTLRLLAVDPAHAARCGIATKRWNLIIGAWLGILLSISVSTLGLLFTFSCLVLPALIGSSLSPTSWLLFFLAPVIALGAAISGIVLSHSYDLPPGQTIAAVLAVVLPLAHLVRIVLNKTVLKPKEVSTES